MKNEWIHANVDFIWNTAANIINKCRVMISLESNPSHFSTIYIHKSRKAVLFDQIIFNKVY